MTAIQPTGEPPMKNQGCRPGASFVARTCAASLCLCLSIVEPKYAMADPHPETAKATVSFADLDVSTASGMTMAQERMVNAVKRLCRGFSDNRKASDSATTTDCYRETFSRAIQGLNAQLAAARLQNAEMAKNTH
jgi:UrcA family protein